MEEPRTPSYDNMCRLFEKNKVVKISKESLCEIEREVLIRLDFSTQSIASINFLERYLRLFGMDQGKEGSPQL